ncbi:MAG: hypothetical protein DWQ08_04830 [Proteobacteria bacterium]|nr:MAG: hypothetical protein DWQ08_04830 [Pseudomonadota bacterium]
MDKKDETSNQPENPATKKAKEGRRRLLGTLAAGGVAGATLPGQWKKPVIDAVVLPAHAQTTGTIIQAGGGSTGAIAEAAPGGSFGGELADFFAGPAHAGGAKKEDSICLEVEFGYVNGVAMSAYLVKLCDFCPKPNKFDLVTSTRRQMSGSGGTWSETVGEYDVEVYDAQPLPEGGFSKGDVVCKAKVNGASFTLRHKGNCDCNCEAKSD